MARLRASVWFSHLPGSAQLASRVTGDREIIEKKLWLKGWVSISEPSSPGVLSKLCHHQHCRRATCCPTVLLGKACSDPAPPAPRCVVGLPKQPGNT